jgi:hypothetical protein
MESVRVVGLGKQSYKVEMTSSHLGPVILGFLEMIAFKNKLM